MAGPRFRGPVENGGPWLFKFLTVLSVIPFSVDRSGATSGLLFTPFFLFSFSNNIDLMLDLHELWCRIALGLFWSFISPSCSYSIEQ